MFFISNVNPCNTVEVNTSPITINFEGTYLLSTKVYTIKVSLFRNTIQYCFTPDSSYNSYFSFSSIALLLGDNIYIKYNPIFLAYFGVFVLWHKASL